MAKASRSMLGFIFQHKCFKALRRLLGWTVMGLSPVTAWVAITLLSVSLNGYRKWDWVEDSLFLLCAIIGVPCVMFFAGKALASV